MGDRLWSTRFRPVMGKAITLLANVLSGSLLDELFAEKCVEEHHYDELVVTILYTGCLCSDVCVYVT